MSHFNSEYFNLHTTGIGYVNRFREVPLKQTGYRWDRTSQLWRLPAQPDQLDIRVSPTGS